MGKRGAEIFNFTMPFMAVLEFDCTARFHAGRCIEASAYCNGRLVDGNGVVLDYPPFGDWIPFNECLIILAQDTYDENKHLKNN